MRILVVGCLGMLGTDLLAELSPVHQVLGIDRKEIDITQMEQCQAKINEFQPDTVINAAALTAVDYCETHEEEAFLVNGYGAGNLSKAAAAVGALFVQYSTDYVFDGSKSGAYVEEDTPNPRSVYGKSKLLGEDLVRKSCPNHLLIRISWLFGRNGTNFIRTIVDAAKKGEPLRIVNDQKGSPSYTKDVASHTVRMIHSGCRSLYHLTNNGFCTWYELAVKAVEWAGIKGVQIMPVSTLDFPRPAPRPANSILANRHLERDGLCPMRPWHAAAREYVERHLVS
jgi:dTDP-4-dehydrorhamnose reductase